MKKNITIICAVLFVCFSCKKYFDKKPFDSLTPGQTFSSEQNVQLYVNSFYVQGMPSATTIFTDDQISDLAAKRDVPDYLTGVFTSQQGTGWNWTPLRNINYFLKNFRIANISEEKKKHYEGIARFFRAWFYFDKVKQFGDVPWYSTALSTNDSLLYKARDPRTLIMDSVLADINYAAENISGTKDNSAETVTKWVALALKSRICLFEGTFRKYQAQFGLASTADVWLSEAVDAAEKVIASKNYSIYNTNNPLKDYRTLFINEKPNSSEILWAVIYNNALEKWHNANWTFAAASYGGNISLNKSFVNTYLKVDGTPFTNMPLYDTFQFQNEVKNRDARLYQTIRMSPYKRSDGTAAPPDFGQNYTGYHILKFSTDDPSIDAKVGNFNSIPIFRFAEILLNYAEAKAELGTFTEGDWNSTIAVLRKRAGIANAPFPTVLDSYLSTNFFPDVTNPALMEIRRERGIELAMEGFRYDDLKRWKKGKLLEATYNGIFVPAMNTLLDLNEDGKYDVSFVTKAPTPKVPGVIYYIVDNTSTKLANGTSGIILWRANVKKSFPDYKYLAPIPYSEIVKNPNLKQNPGWDE